MKRTLNPNLVRDKWSRDQSFPYDEQWVFLRDPRHIVPYYEVGIGPTEIEQVPEDPASVANLKKQLQETEIAFSAISGSDLNGEPCVVLTRDCFGIQGPVRLIVHSNVPFVIPPAS